MDRVGYPSTVEITRPADTATYDAGDVVGEATGSTAAVEFVGLGRPNHGNRIIGAELMINAAAVISGEGDYRLHLYSETPASAPGDNAAFDIPSGDRDAYLGYIDLGTPIDLGSTLYVQSEQAKDLRAVGVNGSVFGLLETRGGHDPTSGRVYSITLHCLVK